MTMHTQIPYDRWTPLAVGDVVALFESAPFQWGLAGGYAVEQFLGRSIRSHGDIDILIFRDEQLQLQCWMAGWLLYAADPPGTLREWPPGEALPYGIHDIWGHRAEADSWELQIMLAEADGGEWFSRHHPLVRGARDELMTVYGGIPCIRVEVQLLYKARKPRPKDGQDFEACLPLMNSESRSWLRGSIRMLFPDGHPWLAHL
jgi:hypothetical protein